MYECTERKGERSRCKMRRFSQFSSAFPRLSMMMIPFRAFFSLCVHNVIVLAETSLEYFRVLMLENEKKRTHKKTRSLLFRLFAFGGLMTKVAYKISLDLDM